MIKQQDTEIDISQIQQPVWEYWRKVASELDELLSHKNRSKNDVIRSGKKVGLSCSRMYALLKIYAESPKVSSIMPQPKNGGKGKSRIDRRVEEIIQHTIEESYLTHQKLIPAAIVRRVKRQCFRENLKVSENTVRSRLSSTPKRKSLLFREGRRVADDQTRPAPDTYLEAKYPLDIVQIDHTSADILLVDEDDRETIGRPNLTIAIDLYSRAITGFHVDLEKPSATVVGLCLINSIFPKAEWLRRRQIDVDWPIWGLPTRIAVDNGKDFRSNALQRGCEEHNISIEYRPLTKTEYGGIVERVIGTLMRRVHELPGTTYSNIQIRGKTKPEQYACLTLLELEKCLTLTICEDYNKSIHPHTNLPPLHAFEKGVYGDKNALGTGLPPVASLGDAQRMLIDFLPTEQRRITKKGFRWNYVTYWHDILKPYLESGDKRLFTIRRDPRDISKIFFFCPERLEYHEIPARNLSTPSLSEWQFKWAKKKLTDLGNSLVDEEAIFRAWDEIQITVEQAQQKTKAVRRQKARAKANIRSRSLLSPKLENSKFSADEQIKAQEDNKSEEEVSFNPEDIEFW
ncbi:transposase [Kordiimonas sp. SCSIO 12603]|uniref:Mu transposase C-terminal domain-containing protein n=1 Tax=Kordiimonas sp. SCSIO 12603 TaxID=2829596 RepID=UPI002103A3D0|nr:Mu transposase C-terminal domain-containing protein [Kordiimonas sp. SCSIO 12603]UTW59036.1 transposase [Kordiimonas sp. SCSIO 12603]